MLKVENLTCLVVSVAIDHLLPQKRKAADLLMVQYPTLESSKMLDLLICRYVALQY